MNIEYKVNTPVSVKQFIKLLNESTLAKRRPVDNMVCIQGMLENSNLVVTAWNGEKLIGISRCITDFHYACYLSDLAVNKEFQGMGIGKKLQKITQQQLGPYCKIILIAAPSANSYYEKLGYTNNERCWLLERDNSININYTCD
ncbi:MAG: GNAT family N-acetyltransferase [Gammaproteobacteria bacterium]